MFKQFINGLLGIKAQEPQPQMGPGEKRLAEAIKLQQAAQEKVDFIGLQREANEKAKAILLSMKAKKLRPYQVQKLEEEFRVEDEDFAVEFHRLLNGEDEN